MKWRRAVSLARNEGRPKRSWGSKPWENPQFRAMHGGAMSDFYKGLAERRRCPMCRRRSAMSKSEHTGEKAANGTGLHRRRCRYCGYVQKGDLGQFNEWHLPLAPLPEGLLDRHGYPYPYGRAFDFPLEDGTVCAAVLGQAVPLEDDDGKRVGWLLLAMPVEANRHYLATRCYTQPRWRGIVPATLTPYVPYDDPPVFNDDDDE